MVDLDPAALQAKGLSPTDVVNAIGAQNLILPARHVEDRRRSSTTSTSTRSPRPVEELNDLPIKMVGGVADLHPRRGARARRLPAADQHRARRRPARRAADGPEGRATPRRSTSSTRIKAALPRIRPACRRSSRSSRSPTSRCSSARRSTAWSARRSIAAGLTALMILLFLGSWRSTVIIAVSIPLSILDLDHRAERARRDDQHHDARRPGARRRHPGRRRDRRDREHQLAPRAGQGARAGDPRRRASRSRFRPSSRRSASASSSCRCSSSPASARYLFVPMAEAVVFAMLASYVLSRTLVPTMAKYLLKAHDAGSRTAGARAAIRSSRVQRAFDARLRAAARRLPRDARAVPDAAAGCSRPVFLAVCVLSLAARCRWVGQDFFPAVDSGQFKLHLRAPTGTRIEETASALRPRRGGDPRGDSRRARSSAIIDNIGLPYSGINLVVQQLGADRRAATPTSWCRSSRGPPADRRLRPRPAAARWRASSPASCSRSSRPTSSARS